MVAVQTTAQMMTTIGWIVVDKAAIAVEGSDLGKGDEIKASNV